MRHVSRPEPAIPEDGARDAPAAHDAHDARGARGSHDADRSRAARGRAAARRQPAAARRARQAEAASQVARAHAHALGGARQDQQVCIHTHYLHTSNNIGCYSRSRNLPTVLQINGKWPR